MNCLETSFIINLLNGNESVIKKYKELEGRTLYTTSITAYELLRLGKDEEKIRSLLFRLIVLDFGLDEVLEAVKIEKALKQKGKMVRVFDILIASIVIKNNFKLITCDNHFKNISNLKSEIV